MYGSRPYKQFNVFIIIFILITLTIISTFTQSSNSETITASLILDQNDGIYFSDDFLEIPLANFQNTTRESENIILDPGSVTRTKHNFSDWTKESSHRMYTYNSIWFNRLIPPIAHLFFANEITSTQIYDRVATKDTETHPINASTTPLKQLHLFQFKINQDSNHINKLGLYWHGKAEGDANTILYYWQPFSFTDNLGTWQIADNTTSNGSFITLQQNFTGDLFIDSQGYVTFCVVTFPTMFGRCALLTDYVSLSTQISGYELQGTVRSMPISPTQIDRWETFIFSDENETATSITYHLLYENQTGNISYVEDEYLPGNHNGITTSPIDLSLVPHSYNLTIQANLTTTDRSLTPIISNWALTWQKEENRWQDSFSSLLRLESNELTHVEVKNGSINLLPILNQWPMIGGETAANTRTSSGLGPITEYNLTWYSSVKVGGQHQNPIVQNGMVYVASIDGKKLYAFDALATTGSNTYNPIENKLNLPTHTIENTPLATDQAVIIATGASQKLGGINNYIYAFDKTLSENPLWRFDFGSVNNDSAISYAASPVYDDGNIYITSWSGDSSILKSVWNFINFSRGNNKIISIDEQGNFNWQFDLPTASFSSPAVKDDTIIAGCEQINGDSLFAVNDQGVKQWSRTVGPIGYASPVINDNKVIVVAKQPSSVYVTANTKVMALQLSNGNIIWEKYIGKNNSLTPYQYAGCNSPVVADDTVYVASADGFIHAFNIDNGSQRWKKSIYSKSIISPDEFLVTSPSYANGILYIGTPDGTCYAIDAETNETIWTKKTKDGTGVISSPVIVDGLLYVIEQKGLIQCLGQHTIPTGERIIGSVLSKPITLPDDDTYQWDSFTTEYSRSRGDITFHIADETGKSILLSDVEDGQSISTDTVNNHDSIRLKADFNAQATGSLSLLEWAVSYESDGDQDNITLFYEDSFSHTDIPPNCSIDVRNQDIGLWNTSAAYRFTYTNESGEQSSPWIATNCSGENRSTQRETIWANISLLDYAENITSYDQIRFSIKDTNGIETFSSWIDFTFESIDEAKPVFDAQLLEPSSGWVKTVTPTCKIRVRDIGTDNNITGLNTSSATYRLNYTDDDGTQTETFTAECSGTLGTKATQTITATISENPESENITDVSAIQFTISDIAGNINSSPWYNLSVDDQEPSSQISNTGSIPAVTNSSPVPIEATAEDNESGIGKVTLYYRLKGSSQWASFGSDTDAPYEWDFTIGNDDGGEYELSSIATDNAGNQESFPSQIQVVFLYDPNPPNAPTFADEYRFTDTNIPTFTDVSFSDDYQLKQVEYRLNFEGLNEWTTINENDLADASYTPTWNLSVEQWNQMQEDTRYYLYFKVTDFLGNTYTTPTQSQALQLIKDIENDTTFDPDLSDFDEWQWDNTYTIRVNTNDSTITLIQLWYRYSSDNTSWSNWTQYDENITEAPYEWEFDLPEGSGYYQFKTVVYTPQGSTEYINDNIVQITTFPLIELIILSVLVIILFVISGIILQRRKRMK